MQSAVSSAGQQESEESSESGGGISYKKNDGLSSIESNSCLKRLNRLTNSYDYIMFYTATCATSGWCS